MIKPFLLGLPRTRSTIIYYKIEDYATKVLNLKSIDRHPEYFLEFSNTDLYFNTKTGTTKPLELFPFVKDSKLDLKFVWPPQFESTYDRNLYKINLLKSEKSFGREYYIKGTINIFEGFQEILDFFKDRKIIITKRYDVAEMIISFVYALQIKMFHARIDNIDRYTELINNPILVDIKNLNLEKYISILLFVNKIEDFLTKKNYNFTLVYYEDINTEEKLNNFISNVLETDTWKQYETKKIATPILVNKDYKKLIKNYNELKDYITERIINLK